MQGVIHKGEDDEKVIHVTGLGYLSFVHGVLHHPDIGFLQNSSPSASAEKSEIKSPGAWIYLGTGALALAWRPLGLEERVLDPPQKRARVGSRPL